MSCGQWGKHTNFELGTRVPLIFHAAGQTTGLKSNTLVESLDICKPATTTFFRDHLSLSSDFVVDGPDPTLAALAGLPPPPDVDGHDLTPLWKDPSAQVSEAVFSEYPRCAPVDAAWTPEPGHPTPQSCVNTARSNFTVMVRRNGLLSERKT